jgi:N6-L-threonylcarbamoyladenine synthase
MISEQSVLIGIESTAWCYSTAVVLVSGELLFQKNSVVTPVAGLHQKECVEQHKKVHLQHLNQVLAFIASGKYSVSSVYYASGPGFIRCLRLGLQAAEFYGRLYGVVPTGVHHGLCHLGLLLHKRSIVLQNRDLILYVSGGHTHVLKLDQNGILGVLFETIDLAVGNVLDKIGRVWGLPHPSGGHWQKIYYENPLISGEVGLVSELNPSYNGLVTKYAGHTGSIEQVCHDLLDTIFTSLSSIAVKLTLQYECTRIFLIGGVAQSRVLQEKLEERISSVNTLRGQMSSLSLHYVQGTLNSDSGYNTALAALLKLEKLSDVPNQTIDSHLSFNILRGRSLCDTPEPTSSHVLMRENTLTKTLHFNSAGGETCSRLKTRCKREIRGYELLEAELAGAEYLNLARPVRIKSKNLSNFEYTAEFISGETLSSLIRRGEFKGEARLIRLFALLHRANIVYGDFRPSNILVSGEIFHIINPHQLKITHKKTSKALELVKIMNVCNFTGSPDEYDQITGYDSTKVIKLLNQIKRY